MPEDEVLHYKADISDFEAKAKRLVDLQSQIVSGRLAGDDVAEVEGAFNKEADALGRLIGTKSQNVSVNQDLIRQKDKLAASVGVLGGSFGGLIGNLGSVFEVMSMGTKAAAGLAGALVGLTAIITLYEKMAEAAERAAAAERQLIEARREAVEGRIDASQAVRDQLEALDALHKYNDALRITLELQKQYGFDQARAGGVAGLAAAAGLTTDQAARLSVANVQQAGITTAEVAQRFFVDETPEERQQREASLDVILSSQGGQRAAARARRSRGVSPQQTVAGRLAGAGAALPEGVEGTAAGIAAAVQEFRNISRHIAAMRMEAVRQAAPSLGGSLILADIQTDRLKARHAQLRPLVDLYEQEQRYDEQSVDPGGVGGFIPGASRSGIKRFNKKTESAGPSGTLQETLGIKAGTVIMAPDRRKEPGRNGQSVGGVDQKKVAG